MADSREDPPGFAAFRTDFERLQIEGGRQKAELAKWLVFWNGDGLGNWMIGAASAFLLAAMTGRRFALLDPKVDVCAWMSSPLCAWTAAFPAPLRELARRRGKKDPTQEAMDKVDLIGVYWQGCSFRKLKCTDRFRGDVSDKQVVLVQSGAWFGDVLLMNKDYNPRLRAAFERRLPDHAPGPADGRPRVALDIYGPLARWLFAPTPAVQRDVDEYASGRLRGPGRTSICIQGRHGTGKEFKKAAKCVDAILGSPWWPRGTVAFHVASMKEDFRKRARKKYGQPGREVHWPSWDSDVSRQKDDVVAYKDMLLMGRCHIAVLPNGGSTFSYMPTALYHNMALRDAGVGKNDCKDLMAMPYEKLFPPPRQQLEKKCFLKGGPLERPC